jgi:hypothetical protein
MGATATPEKITVSALCRLPVKVLHPPLLSATANAL